MRAIEIHGHRGSRGTHPENTLPAFEEARDAGAQCFELDIHLSADDVPIVFHDPVIAGNPVRKLTAARLRDYEIGNVANAAFPGQKPLAGLRMPTLDETLAWLTRVPPPFGINIEMKIEAVAPEPPPDPVRFTRLVLDLVQRHGLVGRTLFQSFDFRPLREAKRLLPELRVSCLFDKTADFAAETAAVGAEVAGPFFRLLTKERVDACHARGIRVIPWTVNEPLDWEWVIGLGVDGIITDYPRALAAHLAR